MLGELQRIDLYSKKGFTIPQKIPNNVRQTFETLVDARYTERSIKTIDNYYEKTAKHFLF